MAYVGSYYRAGLTLTPTSLCSACVSGLRFARINTSICSSPHTRTFSHSFPSFTPTLFHRSFSNCHLAHSTTFLPSPFPTPPAPPRSCTSLLLETLSTHANNIRQTVVLSSRTGLSKQATIWLTNCTESVLPLLPPRQPRVCNECASLSFLSLA